MNKIITLLLFGAFTANAQNVVVTLQGNTSDILMPLFSRLALGLIGCAVILGVSAVVCARILRK